MPLFLDIYFIYKYLQYGGGREDLYIQYFGWGLLVVLSARYGLAAWMQWSCIDVIVLRFKSVEELYPSPP
jgi:hypothetical protein